ncbi:phage tail protein [Pantoea allii]|uniref:phage tail protein n=1 Tax=Pantoea allii TaxID=574096 RepID=UPI00155F8E14|nr:phage tail protein [Pantoea allii]MCH9300021.1 phage tail protein [Pantoea allii]NQS87072.1 phage tail protein [Pantoea allii]
MMMTLGLFVFMLETVPYQELQLQRSWRFPSNNRVGLRPSLQFAGPDTDTLTLSGILLPELTGGRLSLYALEQIAELGRAWPLIEGGGTIYGMFVIESLSQTKAEFFSNGVCRRIEFTLTLKRVDESLGEMFGSLSGQLDAMKSAAAGVAGKVTAAAGGLFS